MFAQYLKVKIRNIYHEYQLKKIREHIDSKLTEVAPTGDFSAGYIQALKDIKNQMKEGN